LCAYVYFCPSATSPARGARSSSFRVFWFLSVFVGFLGSETGKNLSAGSLMHSDVENDLH
jgi:hypothetical protein